MQLTLSEFVARCTLCIALIVGREYDAYPHICAHAAIILVSVSEIVPE